MKSELAIHGGSPIRSALLPYSRPCLQEEDIEAVTAVLRSQWLTCGPKVRELEEKICDSLGVGEAVSVSSGTAALHAALHCLELSPGDEVIVPAITFAATSNAVLYNGATPVFVDVDPDTLLIDPQAVRRAVSPRTKAIIAVDYAGQPCDYEELRSIAAEHDLTLIADACHSLGGSYKSQPVGALADLNVFSFHAVKHLAVGEGGMITTDSPILAKKMRSFRNHGISSDFREREKLGTAMYDVESLGFNYRLSDIQCALALSQLTRVEATRERRLDIAGQYDRAFSELGLARPLSTRLHREHAYHLYVVKLRLRDFEADREEIAKALRAEGIGTNVHYIPVYWHSYYQKHFGDRRGLCPNAENAFREILSFPMFPSMTQTDVDDVVKGTQKVFSAYRR